MTLPVFFNCYTLVDITGTGVIKSDPTSNQDLQRNQQRNWETMIQVLSLRTQPHLVSKPVPFNMDMSDMQFGSSFTGVHRVWQFSFSSEQADVYSVETLSLDLNQVPCIPGLMATADFGLPIFSLFGDTKNTYFDLRDR